MTTATWRAPATSTIDWRRTTVVREQAVEALLVLGSDDWTVGDADVALMLLGQLTGRTEPELRELVDELLDLADRVVEAEQLHMSADALGAAHDDYEALLAHTAASQFDLDVDRALAQVNAEIRDELAARRSR